jgi:hypothetical protein
MVSVIGIDGNITLLYRRACLRSLISSLLPPISGELLANSGKLSARAPVLAATAPARSGDLLFHGGPRRSGGHGRQFREIQRLFDGNR